MICKPCADAADAGQVPHEPCAQGCDCQHGRPFECSPDNLPGFKGYLDALPDDAPERRDYETRTGRKLPPRAGAA